MRTNNSLSTNGNWLYILWYALWFLNMFYHLFIWIFSESDGEKTEQPRASIGCISKIWAEKIEIHICRHSSKFCFVMHKISLVNSVFAKQPITNRNLANGYFGSHIINLMAAIITTTTTTTITTQTPFEVVFFFCLETIIGDWLVLIEKDFLLFVIAQNCYKFSDYKLAQ